jgi:hypothetical protein
MPKVWCRRIPAKKWDTDKKGTLIYNPDVKQGSKTSVPINNPRGKKLLTSTAGYYTSYIACGIEMLFYGSRYRPCY